MTTMMTVKSRIIRILLLQIQMERMTIMIMEIDVTGSDGEEGGGGESRQGGGTPTQQVNIVSVIMMIIINIIIIGVITIINVMIV